MKLVPDWHKAWRWFSVQALAAIAVLPIVWAQLPQEAHEWVPPAYRWTIVAALAIGGIVGRLVDQPKAE